MKLRSILFTAILTLSMVPGFSEENPVLKLFPSDVVFYTSFDDGTCNADMAGGKDKPMRIKGQPTFADGVFGGKALRTGIVTYDAVGNLDLSSPGTIILWVSPENWPAEKLNDKMKEPGFNAFGGNGPDYELIISKMSGQPWGHGHMNTYVQYPSSMKTRHVNCIVWGAGTAAKWKKGEWRMLVCRHSGANFSNSVNAGKTSTSVIKVLMAKPTKIFSFGTVSDEKERYRVLVDEVTVLKKVLTDEEVKKLYDASLKAMPEKK